MPAVLSKESIDLVLSLWDEGRWSQVRLGRALGLSHTTVCKIVKAREEGRLIYGRRQVKCDWSVLLADEPRDYPRLEK